MSKTLIPSVDRSESVIPCSEVPAACESEISTAWVAAPVVEGRKYTTSLHLELSCATASLVGSTSVSTRKPGWQGEGRFWTTTGSGFDSEHCSCSSRSNGCPPSETSGVPGGSV